VAKRAVRLREIAFFARPVAHKSLRPVTFVAPPTLPLPVYVMHPFPPDIRPHFMSVPALSAPVVVAVPIPPVPVKIAVADPMIPDGEDYRVFGRNSHNGQRDQSNGDGKPWFVIDACPVPATVIEAKPGVVEEVDTKGIRDDVDRTIAARDNRHLRRLGELQLRGRLIDISSFLRRVPLHHRCEGKRNIDIDIYLCRYTSDWCECRHKKTDNYRESLSHNLEPPLRNLFPPLPYSRSRLPV
jgi:hypothetical protein